MLASPHIVLVNILLRKFPLYLSTFSTFCVHTLHTGTISTLNVCLYWNVLLWISCDTSSWDILYLRERREGEGEREGERGRGRERGGEGEGEGERGREREREGERGRERERERERVCVCGGGGGREGEREYPLTCKEQQFVRNPPSSLPPVSVQRRSPAHH